MERRRGETNQRHVGTGAGEAKPGGVEGNAMEAVAETRGQTCSASRRGVLKPGSQATGGQADWRGEAWHESSQISVIVSMGVESVM
jgi:hypothetical protein